MRQPKLLFVAAIALLLAACGSGENDVSKAAGKMMDKTSEKMADAAESAAGAASNVKDKMETAASDAGKAVKMAAGDATQYIDHAKDDVEFQLKRSIDGWESMLEDVKDSEQVASIKQHIAELQAKLEKL